MLWQLAACPHTHQLSYLPVPDVQYHVVLVAHGHNVLHIGGEGHTGHAILVAQHLCHLTLLIHIPDAYSRPMPVLGKAGPLLLIGSAPGRARRAFRAEIVIAPGCVQKPPPPSAQEEAVLGTSQAYWWVEGMAPRSLPTHSITITTHLPSHYVLPIRGEGQSTQRLPGGKERSWSLVPRWVGSQTPVWLCSQNSAHSRLPSLERGQER